MHITLPGRATGASSLTWASGTARAPPSREAARSTGLTRGQTMAYVIMPQAVRNVLPDLISNTLEVVKLTSIASVVALPELLFQARQAQSVAGPVRVVGETQRARLVAAELQRLGVAASRIMIEERSENGPIEIFVDS